MTLLAVDLHDADRLPEACCHRCGHTSGLVWREGRFVCSDRRVCARTRRERRDYERGRLFGCD